METNAQRATADTTATSAAPGPGGRRHAAIVAAHAGDLLDAVHVHHSGADELLWPLLEERAAPDAVLIERRLPGEPPRPGPASGT